MPLVRGLEEETSVNSQELSSVLVTGLLRSVLVSEVSPQLMHGGVQCVVITAGEAFPVQRVAHNADSGPEAGWMEVQTCLSALSSCALRRTLSLGLSIDTVVYHILFSLDLPICPWGAFCFVGLEHVWASL